MVTGNAQQRSTQINYELESILNEFGVRFGSSSSQMLVLESRCEYGLWTWYLDIYIKTLAWRPDVQTPDQDFRGVICILKPWEHASIFI
jgi:hypothetical protein